MKDWLCLLLRTQSSTTSYCFAEKKKELLHRKCSAYFFGKMVVFLCTLHSKLNDPLTIDIVSFDQQFFFFNAVMHIKDADGTVKIRPTA